MPFAHQDLFMQRLIKQAELDPHRIVGHILDRHGKISESLDVSTWLKEAAQLAVALQAKGIKKDDRVLLSLPTSREFLISMLGLWWLGAIPVPVPELNNYRRKNSQDRMANVIKDCRPKACLVKPSNVRESESEQNTQESGAEDFFWSVPELMQTADNQVTFKALNLDENSIAVIQYTSGSTDKPKGVIVTHGTLRANLCAMQHAAPFSSQDKLLNWMPLYHDMGLVGGVLLNAYVGSQFYLMSPLAFLGNPSVWLRAISEHKITISTGPNFAYDLCARRINPDNIPQLDLSSWRLAYNGAEPISVETMKNFTKKFLQFGFSDKTFFPVYGMAEMTLAAAFPIPGMPPRIDMVQRASIHKKLATKSDDAEGSTSFVSVGKALHGHSIIIRCPDTQRVMMEREIGEVCLHGPSVFKGYYHQANDGQTVSEHRTGDLGYLADDELFVVDRLKDLIILGGLNFVPVDMERVVEELPFIRFQRSIAFSVYDSEKGTEKLIVVAEVQNAGDEKDMLFEIRKKLFGTFGVSVSDIVICEPKTLPLTSSGKKQRRLCKEMYLNNQLQNKNKAN